MLWNIRNINSLRFRIFIRTLLFVQFLDLSSTAEYAVFFIFFSSYWPAWSVHFQYLQIFDYRRCVKIYLWTSVIFGVYRLNGCFRISQILFFPLQVEIKENIYLFFLLHSKTQTQEPTEYRAESAIPIFIKFPLEGDI